MKKIEYGKTSSGVVVVNRESILPRTPTVIFSWFDGWLEINYNYDCNANTYEDTSFELISKSEFNHIVRQIKERHNVNFTIKLR
jgi:hypothetical protein